ncbi:MAG: hypothetical protein K8J08_15655 [Thermoanaerobaculia bacterium]|nr:hypothetical protein [Thermoanaerobaculia bacterium]
MIGLVGRVLCVLSWLGGEVQAESWPIRAVDNDDGFPSAEVRSIDRDEMGFLWFGTLSGLVRYDGQRFVTWRSGQDLPAVSILDVTWAGGQYWVATSGGLLRSRPLEENFESVPGLDGSEVRLAWTDSEGRLWIGTGSRLLELDPATGRILEEPDFDLSGLEGPALDAVNDPDGNQWFALDGGIVRRSEVGWTTYRLGDWNGSRRVVSLDADLDGCLRLVVGGRLVAMRPDSEVNDSSSEALSRPAAAPGSGTGCPESLGTSWWVGPEHGLPDLYWEGDVLRDREGVVWVSTVDGLFRGDGEGWKPLGEAEGFDSRRVRQLFEDTVGNLWAATKFAGAQVILARGFHTFNHHDGLGGGEPGFALKSLFEGPNGSMLAVSGVEGGERFIEQFDGQRWHSVVPRSPSGLGQMSWGRGQLIAVDSSGSWWVPTSQGLLRWDGVTDVETLGSRLPDQTFTSDQGMGRGQVLSLYEDRHRDLWVGSDGDRPVSRWLRAEGRFQSFGAEEGIPPDARSAYTFAEDRNGHLWIGLYRQGILRWDGSEMRHFGEAAGVPAGRVTDLHVDQSGRLWAASLERGLIVCDDPTAPDVKFRPVTQIVAREGVEAIDEDAQGVFWLGTENGLLRWIPGAESAERLGTSVGLASPRVLALHRDTEGNLWVGTPGGVSRFVEPDEQLIQRSPLITAIAIDGEEVPLSMLGVRDLTLARLSPGDHQMRLHATTPIGALQSDIPMEWRWGKGQWTPMIDHGEVHLAGIGAGDHFLEVRWAYQGHEGPDGVKPPAATLVFSVAHPFWRRPLFALAMIVIAIGSFSYWHRRRVRRLLELDRVRTRVAADLHDDLGGTLSRISLLSELALRELGSGQPLIEEVGESAREGLESMRDLIWALDPRQDDLETLFSRLRDFAIRQLEPVNVSFRMTLAPDLERFALEGEARRDLFLTLKEAITNVHKHAQARNVSVEVVLSESVLEILVDDDGKGIDSGQSVGRGLLNMRQRASNLRSSLTVSHRPFGGTRVALIIPIRQLSPNSNG